MLRMMQSPDTDSINLTLAKNGVYIMNKPIGYNIPEGVDAK